MKKIILLFGIMSSLLMGEKEEVVNVQVTARVIKPIEVVDKKNVDFGTIVAGQENVKAKSNGSITFSGEGKVKLTWKQEGGLNYTSITTPLAVEIRNNKDTIKTKITAETPSEVLDLAKGNKTLDLKGEIAEVSKEASTGSYSGNFTVRAEYID